MTGPTVGGFLLQVGGWTWIFWMNFIVGFAVTAAVVKIFRGPGSRRPEVFDTWGALFLLIGYPALLIALTFGATLGWTSERVLGSFLVAAVALAGFVDGAAYDKADHSRHLQAQDARRGAADHGPQSLDHNRSVVQPLDCKTRWVRPLSPQDSCLPSCH